ncbi:hypothetical protein ABB37_05450 [Leptomonas pyrrhocoris]|uniref:Uncharacterized protein n=1 Tax=Leptomonas pyrrhocoris TaxID=157538 RepID=A0A0N0DV04_LEPPY|nr:hypothetical protein ABB37_05450 [Leptomonas pyrrhocoris]KPA79668.1 hypothetical protein ABB37_05450 [Leptomonas pyrrhocoris]|eukprot:XP_015658107.1 hypothetical protein ABB37_05450 [Leptomonas pyrrhocoris]
MPHTFPLLHPAAAQRVASRSTGEVAAGSKSSAWKRRERRKGKVISQHTHTYLYIYM